LIYSSIRLVIMSKYGARVRRRGKRYLKPAMNPRNIFFLVLALGAVSSLAVCRASEAASLPTGVGNPSAANAKLEKAVKSMFARHEQVRTADLIVRADVTKNQVTLSGTVDSEAVRSRAVELAMAAHVGVVVDDKMTVKPRGSKTAR
jgi:osmotically-inducible protein OsmY